MKGKFYLKRIRDRFWSPCRGRQGGVALVLSMLVLVAASVLAIGLRNEVNTDIGISSNAKRYAEAFYCGESGLDWAEESIGYSVDQRGAETATDSTFSGTFSPGTTTYSTGISVTSAGEIFYLDGGNAGLSGGECQALVTVQEFGIELNEGAALQMAAGYQGVGKGAANFGVARRYVLDSTGTESASTISGTSEMTAVYRYVSASGGR